jgi:hypothetical protein
MGNALSGRARGKAGARLLGAEFNEAGIPAQTSIFVPRHQLAEELRQVIEGAVRERGESITVPILRGRENGGEEGKAPCRRWREARELARKGLPIYTNLCQRKSDGQSSQCPHFAGCEYIQTRQAAYSAPFVAFSASAALKRGEIRLVGKPGARSGRPGRRRSRRSPATTRTIGATASACSAPARRSPAMSESRC